MKTSRTHRTNKACDNCHSQQKRCTNDPTNLKVPCLRCRSLGSRCTYTRIPFGHRQRRHIHRSSTPLSPSPPISTPGSVCRPRGRSTTPSSLSQSLVKLSDADPARYRALVRQIVDATHATGDEQDGLLAELSDSDTNDSVRGLCPSPNKDTVPAVEQTNHTASPGQFVDDLSLNLAVSTFPGPDPPTPGARQEGSFTVSQAPATSNHGPAAVHNVQGGVDMAGNGPPYSGAGDLLNILDFNGCIDWQSFFWKLGVPRVFPILPANNAGPASVEQPQEGTSMQTPPVSQKPTSFDWQQCDLDNIDLENLDWDSLDWDNLDLPGLDEVLESDAQLSDTPGVGNGDEGNK
ncbi:hypothetical protein BKA81DRAFT_401842 [Phyllosticta paracitricarpa]|uniref:Zn(2)-C6 fungal-type domain-containing protein n=2 Tax=Phyllosticta TaxID=121621 RepID=A0ABR1LBY8_9PEZI